MSLKQWQPGDKGPAIYLPGRYRQETQDQERPRFFNDADLIIACGSDFLGRPPMDELRDMALEVHETTAANNKSKRQIRFENFQERWLRRLEFDALRKRKAVVNYAKRHRG